MKIVATVHNANGTVYLGADVESRSAIIEIDHENLPPLIRQYFEAKKTAEKLKSCFYEYLTFSFIDE